MFESIDRNHNGQLDKDELRLAFHQAGLAISDARLEKFFNEIDTDHDGTITFDEWRLVASEFERCMLNSGRNFLLFLPALSPNLNTILSYYSSTISVNPEGDVHVLDESNQGLGRDSLFSTLFGVLHVIATYRKPTTSLSTYAGSSTRSQSIIATQTTTFPWDPGETETTSNMTKPDSPVVVDQAEKQMLTSMLPDTGYFVAGGLAGAISRTATAPLDRLKVFLIAQTSPKKDTVDAVRSGAPLQALQTALRPLRDACLELWRIGGMRSLFAGTFNYRW